jgi:hypothetical protein
MAAGAIPPPLFFEQRGYGSILASGHGIFKNGFVKNTLDNTNQRRSRNLNGRRAQARPPERSPPKDS